MGKEIIINAEKAQTRIAILENGKLAELYIENPDNSRTIGDIYLGRVCKVMPSIQAAFVDIGRKQDAFLHFSDLSDDLGQLLEFVASKQPDVSRTVNRNRKPPRKRGPRRKPHRDRSASRRGDDKASFERGVKIRARRRLAQRLSRKTDKGRRAAAPPEKTLKANQRILVKVVKEPISTKGSRVSTDISMAGRFLVLVPFGNYVAVSKQIHSYKERRRLKALAKSLVPPGIGLIVRTVAQGKDAKTLDTDLRLLLDKWRKMEQRLAGHPKPPMLAHRDVNMLSSVMRDRFSEDYDRVLIDNERLYRNVRNYIQAVAPQMASAVRHHTSKKHVFETAGVQNEIQEAFSERVNLPGGGYLFIEHTEAMHVVDVNSGRAGRGLSQEESSVKVNLEAARAIAKQVRLRDLGGIIVVDFIDLRDEKNRRKIFDELRKEFRKDRAVTKALPMSDFGLIQITRQRLRPSVTVGANSPDFPVQNGASENQEASSPPPRKTPPRENKPPQAKSPPQKPSRSAETKESKPPPGRGRGAARGRRPEPIVVLQEIQQWMAAYKATGGSRNLTLWTHPFTAAWLKKKVAGIRLGFWLKPSLRVRLKTDGRMSPYAFRITDTRSGEDLTRRVAPPKRGRPG